MPKQFSNPQMKLPLAIYTDVWFYSMLFRNIEVNGKLVDISKAGVHNCDTKEEAEKYAWTETAGKLAGVFGELIGVENVTEYAWSVDPEYCKTQPKGKFDDLNRHDFPGTHTIMENAVGGKSREIHILESGKTLEEHRQDWSSRCHRIRTRQIKPTAEYTARPYFNNAIQKIKNKTVDKFLLGATTGGGKETSTLGLHLFIADLKKYNAATINVHVATFPETTCEIIEELASVKGLWYNDLTTGGKIFLDFSRFSVYALKSFASTYFQSLTLPAKLWATKYITVITNLAEMPTENNKVVLLVGSYPDLGLKLTSTNPKYDALKNRLGTLSIGEAHHSLSKDENKLWNAIKLLHWKFLLPVTGTPIDFIFNESRADLYFGPENRILFTRNELYYDKNINPLSDYKDFPDMLFFQLISSNDNSKELTWDELHTFIIENEELIPKYPGQLKKYYTSLLNLSSKSSIPNNPFLCTIAKRHGIIALPTGSENDPVKLKIPALIRFLQANTCLGNYQPLETYENESLQSVKEIIKANKTPTLLFTCNKHLTGANVPQWGFLVFMRTIGDSVKFFEQATGRPSRQYAGKTNCGIFIADTGATLNVLVTVEEKQSLERGENYSTKEILTKISNIYSFYQAARGTWDKFDMPDLSKILEETSKKGLYGINQCVIRTPAPVNFDLIFNDITAAVSTKVVLNQKSNKKLEKKIKTAIKQYGLEFGISEKTRSEYYHNMKKRHVARLCLAAFTLGLKTVQDIVAWITNDILVNDSIESAKIFGKGVELIPVYMLKPTEIDISFTNRWLNKMAGIADVMDFLEAYEEKLLIDSETAFIPEPRKLLLEIATLVLTEAKKAHCVFQTMTVADICAGRGGFLVALLTVAKEMNLALNPKNMYYNDIDEGRVAFFRKLNIVYNLGIPEENITCGNALTREWNMQFDVIIGNPPYQDSKKENSDQLWPLFVETSIALTKKHGYTALIIPDTWTSGTKSLTATGRKNLLLDVFPSLNVIRLNFNVKKYFPQIGSGFSFFVLQKSASKNETVITNNLEEEYVCNLSTLKFIPKNFNEHTLHIIQKVFNHNQTCIYFKFYGALQNLVLNDSKSDSFPYSYINTSSNHANKYGNIPGKGYGISKVVMSYMGSKPKFTYDVSGESSLMYNGRAWEFSEKFTSEGLKSFFESKLVGFINQDKWSQYNEPKILNMLPALDFTRTWTNTEIYQHFNLTPEEIEYIENNVK